MKAALDATYSLDVHPTGVTVYSREIIKGLAGLHPEDQFLLCYRPHRWLKSFREAVPQNARRRILWESSRLRPAGVFHGLNQRLPKNLKCPCLTTFHDLFVLTGDYSSPEFRRRFAEQARDAASRSDLLIAVSHFTASQLRGVLGVDPGRIRVVPHGVRVGPPLAGTRREPIVLHVGAIQRRKNIGRLVEAFEQVPAGWRLILAGGYGYGAEEIAARIERSPRRGDIEVRGYVSDTELAELYSRAAIFAFPSLDEGFGMPVLEAMAAGLAVLTSDGSALREVAGEGALLVDPLSEGAIAAGLNRLIHDDALRTALITRGRHHAAGFTWEAAVGGTWSAYLEVA